VILSFRQPAGEARTDRSRGACAPRLLRLRFRSWGEGTREVQRTVSVFPGLRGLLHVSQSICEGWLLVSRWGRVSFHGGLALGFRRLGRSPRAKRQKPYRGAGDTLLGEQVERGDMHFDF
jgi:hypothetical protein